jgi:type IV pilus assembly protein PilM
MKHRIVGLDVGRSSIRAAQLRFTKGQQPCIEKLSQIDIPEGVFEGGEVLDHTAFSQLLTKLWNKAAFSTKQVVIAAGSLHVFAREIDVPQMSMQRIRESLPFVLDGVLPVAADQLILDFYPIEEGVEDSGLTYKGLAIAAEKSHVDGLVNCLSAARLRPMVVDFAPFALLRANFEDAQSNKLHVYVDVGGAATYFFVARGQVPLFVRILPNGGRDMDRALASSLGITEQQAEKSRQDVDLSSVAKDGLEVRTAVKSGIQELLTGLSSTIDYYEQSHSVSLRQSAKISLSGGVSRVDGFAKLLEATAGMPVQIVTKTKNAKLCDGLKIKEADEWMFTLAIGLALAEVNRG